jgi:hypothetical protein
MGVPAPGWWGDPAQSAPYPPETTAKNELDALKNQADFLKTRLEEVQGRITNLEKSDTGKEVPEQ